MMSDLITDTKKRMEESVEHLRKEYKNLRTGRVNPGMLDDVVVEVYGSQMPLRSLATVSVQQRQLIVVPFDKGTLQAVAKSIDLAPLHLHAMVDGHQVIVPVPPLTEDVRKDTAKQAKKKSEDAKIVVRQVRREANDLLRKQKAEGSLSEDLVKRQEKQVQELTDEYCRLLEDVFKDKEKEILTV